MFSGNNNNDKIDVTIKMLDGHLFQSTVLFSQACSTLDSVLTKPSPFLEIKTRSGAKKFIAKNQILSIEPITPLQTPTPPSAISGRFKSACSILGLKQNCSFPEAKKAFHLLAKKYHPDSFASANLPPEVVSYMNDMFQQINAAFDELKSEMLAKEMDRV